MKYNMLPGDQSVLVVDLDGTLIRSNMLVENFWSALAENWKIPFTSILELLTQPIIQRPKLIFITANTLTLIVKA